MNNDYYQECVNGLLSFFHQDSIASSGDLAKEGGMTVSIGAICSNGGAVILASDRLVSLDYHETCVDKFFRLNKK